MYKWSKQASQKDLEQAGLPATPSPLSSLSPCSKVIPLNLAKIAKTKNLQLLSL